MLRRLAISLIRFYQLFISPLKPPSCRFHPTCSHYAAESIGVHGLLRGGALSAWRILRCNPFVRGGYDPVPARRKKAYTREGACAPMLPEADGPAGRRKDGFQRD